MQHYSHPQMKKKKLINVCGNNKKNITSKCLPSMYKTKLHYSFFERFEQENVEFHFVATQGEDGRPLGNSLIFLCGFNDERGNKKGPLQPLTTPKDWSKVWLGILPIWNPYYPWYLPIHPLVIKSHHKED